MKTWSPFVYSHWKYKINPWEINPWVGLQIYQAIYLAWPNGHIIVPFYIYKSYIPNIYTDVCYSTDDPLVLVPHT